MEPDSGLNSFHIGYQRPIRSRYLDPVELIWYATARRLGLHVRRDPAIFSMTDGTGLLALGPKDTLDADDSAAQMIFHEFCHWITNGLETFAERDWGFALDDELDWREHACLRLQATLAGRHGLRQVLAPTSPFRGYYDLIPADPLEPLPGWPLEERVVARAAEAIARAAGRRGAGRWRRRSRRRRRSGRRSRRSSATTPPIWRRTGCRACGLTLLLRACSDAGLPPQHADRVPAARIVGGGGAAGGGRRSAA